MAGNATLVFLPPGGGDTAAWGGHLQSFGGRHDVLAIDLPGAGTRKGQKPLGAIPEAAAFVEGFLAARGIQRPVLMGYSMGGLIGQALAARNPGAYRGLVLVATAARIKILQEVLDLLVNDPAEARKLMDKFARKPGQERPADEAFDHVVTHAYLKATNDFDAREVAPGITLPTLVLHGDEDKTCPLKFGEWLHQNISGSTLKVFPGASHMLPSEFPGEMEQAVEEFLRGLR